LKVFSDVRFVRAQRPTAENRKTDLAPAKPSLTPAKSSGSDPGEALLEERIELERQFR
jgi:hypothetical protein